MKAITIPKKLAQKDDLVVIPRKEYESLLQLKKIREYTPTAAEKKALERARRNFAKGNTMTLEELENEVGIDSR